MAGRCQADSSHSVLTGVSIMDTCDLTGRAAMEDIMMEPENEMANVVIMEFKVRDS